MGKVVLAKDGGGGGGEKGAGARDPGTVPHVVFDKDLSVPHVKRDHLLASKGQPVARARR